MNAGRVKRRYDTSITLVVTFVLGMIIGSTLTYALLGAKAAPPEDVDTTPLLPLVSTGPGSLPLPSAADLDGLWPAQHLALGMAGTTLSDAERAVFNEFRPGALLLRPENMENPAQTRALIDAARAATRGEPVLPQPLVLYAPPVDVLDVLFQASGVPTPQALGEANDLEQARAAGRTLAGVLQPYGVEIILLPVLDVFVANRTPNPLRVAHLGEDPERVAALALALADGIGAGGILPVLGRFPGMGAAQKDLDGALVVLENDIDLLATWMLPFQEAAAHGVPGISVAHAALPALHAENIALPASLSPKLIRHTLRETWAFEGVVVAEEIENLPAARQREAGRAFIEALAVGCDLILVRDTTRDRVQALSKDVLRAVQSGQLPEAVLAASKGRIAEWRATLDRIQSAPEPPATPEVVEPVVEPAPVEPAHAPIEPETPEAAPESPEAPPAESETEVPAEAESAPAPVAEPEAEATPAVPEEDPAAQPPGTKLIRHTIERGDRLGAIAGRYGVSIEDVKTWNGLEDDTIKWGQKLKIYQPDDSAAAPPEAEEPAETTPPAPEAVEAVVAPEAPADSVTEASAPASVESPEVDEIEAPEEASEAAPSTTETPAAPVAEPRPPNTVRRTHTLAAGETLASVANEYGVTEDELRRWNALPDGDAPAGTALVFYLPTALPPAAPEETADSTPAIEAPVAAEVSEAVEAVEAPAPVRYDSHRIVPGDTLYRIASRYKTTPAELIEINGLKNPNDIQIGRALKVPAQE